MEHILPLPWLPGICALPTPRPPAPASGGYGAGGGEWGGWAHLPLINGEGVGGSLARLWGPSGPPTAVAAVPVAG